MPETMTQVELCVTKAAIYSAREEVSATTPPCMTITNPLFIGQVAQIHPSLSAFGVLLFYFLLLANDSCHADEHK